jgi:hypothetical protein
MEVDSPQAGVYALFAVGPRGEKRAKVRSRGGFETRFVSSPSRVALGGTEG